MKTLPLLLVALTPLNAFAADWRQYASQPTVDYFFDAQSVKRTAGAFEAVIRLREKQGDDMATRVAVDCKAATFRKLDVGLVEDERYVAKTAEAGDVLAVGKGFVAPLVQGWCIDWSEPPGAVWHEFGKSASTTHYIDETPFKRNSDFDRGVEGDFTATVKSVGDGLEMLQRFRIDCRSGRYEPLGGIARQAGVVSRIEPGPAEPIQPRTQPDILKRLLCRQDLVAERQRRQREQQLARENIRRQTAGTCEYTSDRLNGLLSSLKSSLMYGTPLCSWVASGISSLQSMKSEAIRAGCGNYEQIDSYIAKIRNLPCE